MVDKVIENNKVCIVGKIVSEFEYSHEVFGEGFSRDSWSIQDSRLSGYNELTRKYDGQVLLRTDYDLLNKLCLEYQLLASFGSDFHQEGTYRELGLNLRLEDCVKPVWTCPQALKYHFE